MPDTTLNHTTKPDVTELLGREDVQAALTELLQQLPKLAVLTSLLGKGVDVAKEVLTDGDLMGGVEELVTGKLQPYQTKVSQLTSMLHTAKVRAEGMTNQIGIFGVMGMLKDPNVQFCLHYVQALSDLMTDYRKSNRVPMQ